MDPVSVKVWIWALRYGFPVLGGVILWRLRRLESRSAWDMMGSLLLVTLFQILGCSAFLWTGLGLSAAFGYGCLAVSQWVMLLVQVFRRDLEYSLETLAFFLSGIGLSAAAAVKPGEITKQTLAVMLGAAMYWVIVWTLQDEHRAKRAGWCAMALSAGLLMAALLGGEAVYGARNWLRIGMISIQPSELCKVGMVYGTLLAGKKWVYGAYTAGVVALLVIMNDLGTAAVFCAGFLTVIYLSRGGGTAMASLAVLGSGMAAFTKLAPHAAGRMAVWRHIWQQPMAGGFQQTRGLMCIASGGLFGLGVGAGKMGRYFSADSDMVFASVSETWGLLLALMPVAGLVMILRSAAKKGSIPACTAAVMLCVQGALNVLGSVDVLPMTGVPLPFVSNGGTGMVAAWGLLAFIKGEKGRIWENESRLCFCLRR